MEALWSQFENVMAKEPEEGKADDEGAGGEDGRQSQARGREEGEGEGEETSSARKS